CPTVTGKIISSTTVQNVAAVISAPDDHFAVGQDDSVVAPRGRRICRAGGCPTVRDRVVPSAGGQNLSTATITICTPAPDDHFAAGPCRGVNRSGSGGIGRAGDRPTIRAGIVSAAGVERTKGSAPDDHFTPGPH